ncbi:MAG: ribbon-helix-helix protein, CopG family [Anaerolineales bacterium]
MITLEIAISLAEEEIAEIDQIAAAQQLTRAEFVRQAVRQAPQQRRRYTRPLDDPQVREAVAEMHAIAARDTLTSWDSAAEVRRWRDRQN